MALRTQALNAGTANAARQSLEEQIQHMGVEELKKRALNGLLKLDQTEQTKAAQAEFEKACQPNRSHDSSTNTLHRVSIGNLSSDLGYEVRRSR